MQWKNESIYDLLSYRSFRLPQIHFSVFQRSTIFGISQCKHYTAMLASSTILLAQGENCSLFCMLYIPPLPENVPVREGEKTQNTQTAFDTGCTQSHVMELRLKDGEMFKQIVFCWIMKYFLYETPILYLIKTPVLDDLKHSLSAFSMWSSSIYHFIARTNQFKLSQHF